MSLKKQLEIKKSNSEYNQIVDCAKLVFKVRLLIFQFEEEEQKQSSENNTLIKELQEKYNSILLKNYGVFRETYPIDIPNIERCLSETKNLREDLNSLVQELTCKNTELDSLKQKLKPVLDERIPEGYPSSYNSTCNLDPQIENQFLELEKLIRENNLSAALDELDKLFCSFIAKSNDDLSKTLDRCFVFLIAKKKAKWYEFKPVILLLYSKKNSWVDFNVDKILELFGKQLDEFDKNSELVNKVVTEEDYIIAEKDLLNSKIKRVKEQIQEVDDEINKLLVPFAQWLAEQESQTQDKTAGYVTDASDSRPRNYELISKFSLLKSQTFQSTSDKIFKYLYKAENSSIKIERSRKISEIKSKLSQGILIEGMALLGKCNFMPGDSLYEDEVRKIYSSVCQILKISQTETADFPCSEIKEAIRRSLELVRDIKNADPPGTLRELNGEIFDPDRHEPVLGCEESGTVEFTVYPAYLVGERVFAKAVVFTSLEKGV